MWPVKSRQMSIKVAPKDCTRNIKDFDTFTKIAKIVGNLDKIILATGFEKFSKVQSGHTAGTPTYYVVFRDCR